MLELINQLDTRLFLWLNGHHSMVWDDIMVFVSGKFTWTPFYVLILLFIIRERGWHFWKMLLFIVLAIVLCDQLSVLVKETVQRFRPCHEPAIAGLVHTVNGKCGGKFGFVSSHAANAFGLASFTALALSKGYYSVMIYTWAALVSYSRVYLGVHYPADILGGALLGVGIGWSLYRLKRLFLDYQDRFRPAKLFDRMLLKD